MGRPVPAVPGTHRRSRAGRGRRAARLLVQAATGSGMLPLSAASSDSLTSCRVGMMIVDPQSAVI